MDDDFEEDPTLKHARRELRVVICLVVCVMSWAILVCATAGFRGEGTNVPLVWGMPGWAVWGILIPWLVMLVLNYWLGLWYLADDDLSRDDIAQSDVLLSPHPTEMKDAE